MDMEQTHLQRLASDLLSAVKKGEPTEALEAQLSGFQPDRLTLLSDDTRKKAFWINMYNASFQILAARDKVSKPAIYREPLVNIGGYRFSLDDIEHGVLRKYRYKPALGFLPNPFAKKLIRQLAVAKIDYRIHFALNCGAVSCPPIARYDAEQIEQQLDLATLAFLESETKVSAEKKEIHVSRLMLWYLGDFGGRRGIRRLLQEKLHLETRGWRIVFSDYNWDEQLHAFAD